MRAFIIRKYKWTRSFDFKSIEDFGFGLNRINIHEHLDLENKNNHDAKIQFVQKYSIYCIGFHNSTVVLNIAFLSYY